MIVATLRHGQLTILDRLRETVRLAEGLSSKTGLTVSSKARALECLARFGERLRDVDASNVRAAGTNTLRRARRETGFLAEAEAALGHPIEIISGFEEARLIYLGVAHSLPPIEGRRLVLDIGGGSTELILGSGEQPEALESISMGCVGMTERFFADGSLTRKAFDRARTAARLKLQPVQAQFRNRGWEEAIGASGTIRSAETVARELGLLRADGLTLANVEALIDRMIERGRIERLDLPGLSPRRAQVWAGGLSVLAEIFSALEVRHMNISDGALREGLLYDLVGRLQHADARERTVQALVDRYHVDREQSERVAAVAGRLLSRVSREWKLEQPLDAKLLEWAARLHEIGLDISHHDFHEHGAYIVEHGDLPGFPRLEQQMLACLIAFQRKRPDEKRLARLPEKKQKSTFRLALLLRLAALLNRSRSPDIPLDAELVARKKSLVISFPDGWLDNNPLTLADLDREIQYLKPTGYRLEVDFSGQQVSASR
ncbi:MAG: Ppx/GppA phosphatase family protein [Gammaproteobacteria bacterium]|jgi:exopolyphosphatase/guanosine-5'-triphosphate,3'-diphosphate pyrophosphatase